MAYLAGGRNHAVQVAHLGLYEQGLVEVPDEVLERTDPTRAELVEVAAAQPARPTTAPPMPEPPHIPGAAGLGRLGPGRGSACIVRVAAASPEMAAVHDRLAARGLAVDAALADRLRWGALAPAAVFLVGLARLVAGAQADRPGLWLALLLLVTIGIIVAALVAVPRATPRGRRLVVTLRERGAIADVSPVTETAEGQVNGHGSGQVNGVNAMAVARAAAGGAATVAPALAASFGFLAPAPGRWWGRRRRLWWWRWLRRRRGLRGRRRLRRVSR